MHRVKHGWYHIHYSIGTNSDSDVEDVMQLLSPSLKSRIISLTATLPSLYLIIPVHSSYGQFLRTRNSSHFDPPQFLILRTAPFKFKESFVRFSGDLGWYVAFF